MKGGSRITHVAAGGGHYCRHGDDVMMVSWYANSSYMHARGIFRGFVTHDDNAEFFGIRDSRAMIPITIFYEVLT
jgi:hypothetical protein